MSGALPRVGLQLYSLRALAAEDLGGLLATVGELGFAGVELPDLYGHSAEQVRRWLDDAGLVAVARHAGLAALETGLPSFAAELATLGTDRIVIAWIDPPRNLAGARATVERIATVAAAARTQRLRLGFHNHDDELSVLDGERTTLDLLRALPPDLLWLELDLGWIWAAGADPAEELGRTRGRCPLVHVKDLRAGPTHTPVGDGEIDYARILPQAGDAGVEWLIIEQDEIEAQPLHAVARSLASVQAILDRSA